MIDTKHARESQELWIKIWQQWLSNMGMNEQILHGMGEDQRGLFDEIAEMHSIMLQQTLTMTLQYVSLNGEIAERYVALVHKFIGIKT